MWTYPPSMLAIPLATWSERLNFYLEKNIWLVMIAWQVFMSLWRWQVCIKTVQFYLPIYQALTLVSTFIAYDWENGEKETKLLLITIIPEGNAWFSVRMRKHSAKLEMCKNGIISGTSNKLLEISEWEKNNWKSVVPCLEIMHNDNLCFMVV